MSKFFLFFLFFLIGCSPSTLDEWRMEGISTVRELVKELEAIDTFKDLVAKKKVIKRKYLRLVEIMIEADKYIEDENTTEINTFYSDMLRMQYIRLFQIQGCQELLYDIQKESLHKLDKFLQNNK